MDYYVKHKFREKIIIPYAALYPNIPFITNKSDDEEYIVFVDKTRARVSSWEEKHICELEKEIKEIYNVDVYSWLKAWYKSLKDINTMYMLVINLKKV